MELINEIKLRLKKFIGNKVDKSITEPIKILEDNGVYYLIFKNSKPASFLTARSLDGIDFDLTESYKKLENFLEQYNAYALVPNPDKRKKKIMYFGDRHIYLARSL